jgi:hypothetical protein
MCSRSNNRANVKVDSRRVTKSLEVASQVSEKIHPRNNTAQNLADRHQLMNAMETFCLRDDDGRHNSMTLLVSKLA